MKKIATRPKKSTDDPGEESIIAAPEEEPITEDPKKNLSLRTLKKIIPMSKLKRTLSL